MASNELQTTEFVNKEHLTTTGLNISSKLFLFSLLIPTVFFFGDIRLSAYRVLLVFLITPFFFNWLLDRKTKKCSADWFILLFVVWAFVSFSVNHGFSAAIEPSGIMFLETFGSYIIARLSIRDHHTFEAFAKVLFWIVIALAPGAVFEALTGRNITLEVFNKIGPAFGDVYKEPRLGLDRVQSTFEHPILFGVFCGSALGLTYFVVCYKKSKFMRLFWVSTVFSVAALALSSGPLAALTAQLLLIFWNIVLAKYPGRWKLLAALTVIAFLTVEAISNRSSPAVFISYFAFNEHTAYNRLMIWHYGVQNISNNPLFGLGFNEWVRAWYMSTSMDMFWLIHAVRHGIPAIIFLFTAILIVIIGLMRRKSANAFEACCKLGYLTTFFGFFISGWTVHYWNSTYVLFMFFLGAGVGIARKEAKRQRVLDQSPVVPL